ncbi:MAG: GNAT family N-acetyltransferase [Bacteroidales bacterium]|nr:GNAT family N-acetyltransferase [Bacteroidales bacterium]
MESSLTFIRWNTDNAEESRFFETLYVDSFPSCERRELDVLRAMIPIKKHFSPYIILEKQKMVGLITSWDLGTFVYIEHFAIDPSLRGGGIGYNTMAQFCDKVNKPVVLEVEKPETDIARRRIGFYNRLNFNLHTHPYMQPPYGPDKEPLELFLMSYGFSDFDKHFEQVESSIHTEVYGIEPKN